MGVGAWVPDGLVIHWQHFVHPPSPVGSKIIKEYDIATLVSGKMRRAAQYWSMGLWNVLCKPTCWFSDFMYRQSRRLFCTAFFVLSYEGDACALRLVEDDEGDGIFAVF